MSQPDYSLQGLYSFIVIDKGLIKRATAKNWKNAASRLFSILEDGETGDLRSIDVDALCRRYANINGKDVTPSSLKVYRSRLKTALSDFVTYTDNPMSYSPGIAERASRKKKPSDPKGVTQSAELPAPPPARNVNPSVSNGGVAFPIPLREDLTIQIVNVPFDLTEAEAEKVAMVIKALAIGRN